MKLTFKVKTIKPLTVTLKKADIIFSDKKAHHYLVYNDLLLAQTTLAINQYSPAKMFAINAFDNADQLNLLEEKKQALQLQITAYKHLNQYALALSALENWIQLDSTAQIHKKNNHHANAILAQQKLQSTLTNANHRHNSDINLQNRYQFILAVMIIFMIFLSMAYLGLWRNRRHMAIKLTEQSQYLNTDPITNLPDYNAFISRLSKSNINQPCCIALCALSEQLNADFTLDLKNSRDLHQAQYTAISQALNTETFYIRPGVFALFIPDNTDATCFMHTFRDCLNNHQWQTSLHVGLLNLPLHADPAIKVELETHFGTAQMMLAGAMSLGPQQDTYVTMTTLDFAPASIFTPPLYPQLKRNIERGLIKIETNGDKNGIIWP